VQSIRCWLNAWERQRYPDARELTVTADCGGSNGARVRLWKLELQKLADETGLVIRVRLSSLAIILAFSVLRRPISSRSFAIFSLSRVVLASGTVGPWRSSRHLNEMNFLSANRSSRGRTKMQFGRVAGSLSGRANCCHRTACLQLRPIWSAKDFNDLSESWSCQIVAGHYLDMTETILRLPRSADRPRNDRRGRTPFYRTGKAPGRAHPRQQGWCLRAGDLPGPL
jgi:hypothetical protein